MFMEISWVSWVVDGLWEKAVAESGSPAPHVAVALARWQEGEQFVCWVGRVFGDISGSLAAVGRVQVLDGWLGWSGDLLCSPHHPF